MRSSSAAPPPVAPVAVGDDVRTYRFLTPVFGGGVEPKDFDPVTPIRVASIRGQLRFWWRAVNPRGCPTVTALRTAEEAVFGSVTTASRLSIRVSRQPGPPVELAVFEGEFKAKAGMTEVVYGAFSLRNPDDPRRHGVLHEFGKQTFELTFTYPSAIEPDVHAALWGWAHFGALGGRTRRGFGAIAQESPKLLSIEEGWAKFVKSVNVQWPHLENKPAVSKRGENDGLTALKALLGALRRLRQDPGIGRRRGDGAAHGRSYWPEPDAIRQLFPDQVGEKHRNPVTDHECFPRAAFGTPIIFHFKDGGKGDPRDSTLLPKGKGRLASRLILRPHLGENSKVQAMCIVLAHPEPPSGYVLKQGEVEHPVSTTLEQPLLLGEGAGRQLTDPIKLYLEEIKK